MERIADVYISSVTGNTRKVAESLISVLVQQGFQIRIDPETPTLSTDLTILCFWCRKAGPDPLSIRRIRMLSGRRILAFGTMGSYPNGDYAEQVRHKVSSLIAESGGICPGVFLCQGKIPVERTEARRALPPTAPHHLDDEGYARHLESRKHPSVEDLDHAVRFLEQYL